jgi:hypothetical protein
MRLDADSSMLLPTTFVLRHFAHYPPHEFIASTTIDFLSVCDDPGLISLQIASLACALSDGPVCYPFAMNLAEG